MARTDACRWFCRQHKLVAVIQSRAISGAHGVTNCIGRRRASEKCGRHAALGRLACQPCPSPFAPAGDDFIPRGVLRKRRSPCWLPTERRDRRQGSCRCGARAAHPAFFACPLKAIAQATARPSQVKRASCERAASFRPVWGRSTYRWLLVVPVIAWVLCPGCVQRTPTHRVDVYLSSWPHSGVNRLVESTACCTICRLSR